MNIEYPLRIRKIYRDLPMQRLLSVHCVSLGQCGQRQSHIAFSFLPQTSIFARFPALANGKNLQTRVGYSQRMVCLQFYPTAMIYR